MRRLVLGVTGSIAVYKAVDLASKLTQANIQVDVIMTEAAQKFVTPLTFQAVTGHPVYTALWETDSDNGLPTHIAHVGLGDGADLFVVAPATANILAKLAHGLADDLLTVTALATQCPLMVAPAMDGAMYSHVATQANISILRERGVIVVEPEEGRFASGLIGKGRLPETPTLLGEIRRILGRNGLLQGKKVVVTAGGTREAIDPVRYISNHSSGKQGYAIAQAALDMGAAEVILISTTDHLPLPIGATLVLVDSAEDMLKAVQSHTSRADLLIMAAAVADFRPATIATQKIKKADNSDEGLTLSLIRNPDILLAVKSQRQATGYPRLVVGFAAESQDLLANAKAKLERKGLDLIVANDITASDAGFGTDTNRVVILDRFGGQQKIDLATKTVISDIIIARAAKLLDN